MFIIDKEKNEAHELPRLKFSDLKYGEVHHLQEWIRKNPAMLGDDDKLLIIQKEFKGFDKSDDRLDLLALDQKGNLVIIENKLDDSGKDVTGQALKYASFFTTATQEKIIQIFQNYLDDHYPGKKATEELCDFFETDGDFTKIPLLNKDDRKENRYQRIILVAREFRPEVTSTVLWLAKHKIKIKCIKVTPHKHGDDVFIDTEQIIPVREVEEYQVNLAEKRQEEKRRIQQEKLPNGEVYHKFWELLHQRMNEQPDSPFKDVTPQIEPCERIWIRCGSNHCGLEYHFAVVEKKSLVRVEVITKSNMDANELKDFSEKLHRRKDEIESKFDTENTKFEWYATGTKRRHIDYSLLNVSIFSDNDWDKMIDFLVENTIKMEAVVADVLQVELESESEISEE